MGSAREQRVEIPGRTRDGADRKVGDTHARERAGMNLQIDALACRRGGRLVFHDINLQAAAGESVLVRGPNGVGKSTLLRVLAGLIPPAAGDVQFDRHSLASEPSAFQERVVYAGHLDAIKPALTVVQNLGIWANLFGTGQHEIDDALAYFGLDAIAGRPAAQCSAGQKRRLGLARLMVIDRPLWLLDEPTVSLDAESAGLVARLVREHCAAGGLALIATHIDLDLDDPPVLAMTHPTADGRETGVSDAFLSGDW